MQVWITAEGVRWISGGTGEFEVQTIEKSNHGTDIILHLRDDALDYLESWKVKQIINKIFRSHQLANRNAKEIWQEEEVAEGESLKAVRW